MLVVLVLRAEIRLDLAGANGDALSVFPVFILGAVSVSADAVFVDEANDLESRDEPPPRLLVFLRGGRGGLISCSVASPGLLACLGRGNGLVRASWRWPVVVGFPGPWSFLLLWAG